MLVDMKRLGLAIVSIVSCAALLLAAMDEAAARGGGGGGRSSGGGSRGAGHSGSHSHHNHHRFHSSFFVGFGVPLFWGPSYYYAPGYYEPLPVYIEQNPPSPEQGSQYWYYCPSARTYYPYVGDCPEGWQRVLPEANPQPTNPQPPAG
jgi:hypothetical protein